MAKPKKKCVFTKYFDIDTKRPIKLIGKEKYGYQKVKYSDGKNIN